MKKLLIYFVLIIFASCEKDSPDCYTCHIRTVKSSVSIISDTTIEVQKCDVTASDILEYESENTKTWTQNETAPVGTHYTARYEQTCNCIK